MRLLAQNKANEARGRSVPGRNQSLRTEKARGVVATWTNLATSTLGPLVLVPIYLHFLGARLYGLWIVVAAIMPVISLANFGLSFAAGNRLAEDFACGRTERRSIVASTFFAYAGLALAAAGVTIPLIWVIASRSKSDLRELGGEAAIILCCLFFAGLPLKTYQAALRAVQRVDIEQWSGAAAYLAKVAAISVALVLGWGLRTVAAIQGITLALPGFICFWGCRALLGTKWPKPIDASWQVLGPMLRPSVYFFILQVATTIAFGIDSWIIAQHLGASAVTPYGISYQAIIALDIVWWASLGSLAPWVTAQFAVGNLKQLSQAYNASIRIGVMYLGAIAVFLAISGRDVLQLWTRQPIFPGQATWNLLLVYLAFQLLLSPADILLTATSHHVGYAKLTLLESLLNLALSLWWVRTWGTPGVIAGTVVARACTNLWFMPMQCHRLLGSKGSTSMRSQLPRAALAAAAGVSTVAAVLALHGHLGSGGGGPIFGLLMSALFAAIYATLAPRRGELRSISRIIRHAWLVRHAT